MKKLTQTCLMLLVMIVAFAGCDAAQDAANKAKDKAGEMANIDFGSFDKDALKEKLTGVTDGLKGVTEDNVDGLKSKITDLSGSMDEMGIDKLPAPAKTFVAGMLSKFGDSVKSAMSGITNDGILAKLKPVVDGLMEKINAFK